MDQNVDIFARNMEVTERIQTYVTKKVAKFDRLISDVDETRVELAYIKSGKGFILRAEERADDLFAAIDEAVDKMQRQISRYKGKRQRGRGDGTPASEVAGDTTAIAEESAAQPLIARRKVFTMVPMNELEAVEQMKLLGHENFFVFYNVDSNAINVLYTRRDGSYGLIEPKIG